MADHHRNRGEQDDDNRKRPIDENHEEDGYEDGRNSIKKGSESA